MIASTSDLGKLSSKPSGNRESVLLATKKMPSHMETLMMTVNPPRPVATMTCILSSFGGLITMAVTQPINKPAVMLQSTDSSHCLVNTKQQGEDSLQGIEWMDRAIT